MGKDLILLDGEKQTFIQVKRRTQAQKVEPVSSIRDLIGASVIGDADACVFVTTAECKKNRKFRFCKAVIIDEEY